MQTLFRLPPECLAQSDAFVCPKVDSGTLTPLDVCLKVDSGTLTPLDVCLKVDSGILTPVEQE